MFDGLKKGWNDFKDTVETENKWRLYLKENNIDEESFQMFLNRKDVKFADITMDLIEEYQNLDNLIENISIPCNVSLNESFSNVQNDGALLSAMTGEEYNFTNTTRSQVDVTTQVFIAKKGIVFKQAINEAQDLRIAWEDITDCKMEEAMRNWVLYVKIFVNDIVYDVMFGNGAIDTIDVGKQFAQYVQEHRLGVKDDGWD